jgi:hypothetical protein
MGLGEGTILDLHAYSALRPMLYHVTSELNLASIQHTRVLCSSAMLTSDRCHTARSADERVKRDQPVIMLRDQLALRPGQVDLTGGWQWQDLVAALNGRVFFWPGDHDCPNRYGRKFLDTYCKRGQRSMVLRFGFWELIQANLDTPAYFCRFNSGAPRISGGRRSPRGPDTFLTADEWCDPPSRAAEVYFVRMVTLSRSTSEGRRCRLATVIAGQFQMLFNQVVAACGERFTQTTTPTAAKCKNAPAATTSPTKRIRKIAFALQPKNAFVRILNRCALTRRPQIMRHMRIRTKKASTICDLYASL